VDQVNPTQGSLLGLLAGEPKSGWELLREARAGLARFWNVTSSHVYRELKAMESEGLVSAGRTGVRERRPYRITAAGRRAFHAWLREPPEGEQLRIPLLVRLWFARDLDRAVLAGFVRSAREDHRERLRLYDELSLLDVDQGVGAVLDFGRSYERMFLAWLDRVERSTFDPLGVVPESRS
jgi:DNA-binding PadR family transcriptional regulator